MSMMIGARISGERELIFKKFMQDKGMTPTEVVHLMVNNLAATERENALLEEIKNLEIHLAEALAASNPVEILEAIYNELQGVKLAVENEQLKEEISALKKQQMTNLTTKNFLVVIDLLWQAIKAVKKENPAPEDIKIMENFERQIADALEKLGVTK